MLLRLRVRFLSAQPGYYIMHKFNIRRIGNVKASICNISTYIHAAPFHGNRKRHHPNCVRNKKITETKNISSEPRAPRENGNRNRGYGGANERYARAGTEGVTMTSMVIPGTLEGGQPNSDGRYLAGRWRGDGPRDGTEILETRGPPVSEGSGNSHNLYTTCWKWTEWMELLISWNIKYLKESGSTCYHRCLLRP